MNDLLQQEKNLSNALQILVLLQIKAIGDSVYGNKILTDAETYLRHQNLGVRLHLAEYFSEEVPA